MNDICLKFDSDTQAQQVLTAAGLLTEDGPVPGIHLHVVGVISRQVGEPAADAETPPVMEQLPGWHVNVLLSGDVPELLQPCIVTPKQRMSVWAVA
jgi:hypothetical protein